MLSMPSFTITKRYNQKELSNHMIFFSEQQAKMYIKLLFHGELILSYSFDFLGVRTVSEPIFGISFAYTRSYEKQWQKVQEDHCTAYQLSVDNNNSNALRQLPFYQCPIDNLPSKDIMREIQEKEFVTQPPFLFIPLDMLMYFYFKLSTQFILDFVATEFSTQLENTCFFY